MKKLIPIIIAIVVILLIVLAVLASGLSTARQESETQLRSDNPTFHTVEEGGTCREGEGDCMQGLTCDNGICIDP